MVTDTADRYDQTMCTDLVVYTGETYDREDDPYADFPGFVLGDDEFVIYDENNTDAWIQSDTYRPREEYR